MKFENVEQKHLLLNEFLTMTLAREMGYNTAQVNMLHVGPYRTLEVIRFDRQMIGDNERIVKVARQHMIDACQALGLTSTKKYERHFGDGKDVVHIREGVSLAKLFSLTAFAKDPVAMKDELLNWLLFNLLVGNTDAHGKNFSFFVDQAGLTPTPWYDLLSIIQIPTVNHSLAMSIGDKFEYDNIHALQLLHEAEKINVPFDMLQERLQISIETMRSALLTLPLTVELSKEEQAFVARYKDSLFLRLNEWQAQCRLMPQLAQDSSLF